MGFGQYADFTVQQIIDSAKCLYLAWIYYNMEGISFIDEILINVLHLNLKDDKFTIKKPGTNPELFNEYVKVLEHNRHGVEGRNMDIKHRKRQKARNVCKERRRELFYYQKSYLQSKNHGH